MKMFHSVLAAVVLAGVPALALANITTSLVPNSGSTIPAGYKSYDLKITSDTDWTNQRLDLTLTQGSIYQDGFGGDTQPNPLFFSIAPSLQWDTFFTTPGGFPNTAGTGTAPGFAGTNTITSTTLGVSWFDSVTNAPGTYTVARLTLSDNAVGAYSGNGFDAQSGGTGTYFSGNINVPEPASLAVLGLGAVALMARKRRA